MAETILAGAASSWAVLMGIAPLLQIRRMLREQSSRRAACISPGLIRRAVWGMRPGGSGVGLV
jgi:hypothetical protein